MDVIYQTRKKIYLCALFIDEIENRKINKSNYKFLEKLELEE